MKKDSKTTETVCKVWGDDLKSCREAFVGNPWYIIEVNPRYEMLCCKDLAKFPFPIDTYVASQQEVHRYSNGTRRTVERLVITKKVFVRFPADKRTEVLTECPYALRYMVDAALRPSRYGRAEFAQVPDWQILQLRRILTDAEAPVEYNDFDLLVGEKVKVIGGKLLGREGKVYQEKGKTFLVLTLDKLGSFKVQIAPEYLKRIK